jgi:hypothetical protein
LIATLIEQQAFLVLPGMLQKEAKSQPLNTPNTMDFAGANMKKGQSISINTIVVAAIAIVVMILIVMIFTGNIASWRRNVDSCQASGGRCIHRADVLAECAGPNQKIRPELNCYVRTEPDPDLRCCITT